MQVLSPEEAATAAAEGTAVTIGAYDGVHLGHRRILRILAGEARGRGVSTAVVTFDRHPATVIRPASAPALLTDPEQKLELLAACGVDFTVVVPFDAHRAAEPAEAFVDELLVGALRARLVVVGEDFHFGRDRKGNVALLRALGGARGFDVMGVALAGAPAAAPTGGADPPRGGRDDPTWDGGADGTMPSASSAQIVSSTRIRALVAAGDVAQAAALLARPHEVRGPVVHGDGRGGALGMPTANVAVAEGIAVPAVGIYAGWCRRADGSRYPAAISVGHRPTFYEPGGPGAAPLVEAHLVDFGTDLYGERVGVAFAERLRPELRFDRVEDLVAQMHADVARVRSVLGV